jgi:hypothetical protein
LYHSCRMTTAAHNQRTLSLSLSLPPSLSLSLTHTHTNTYKHRHRHTHTHTHTHIHTYTHTHTHTLAYMHNHMHDRNSHKNLHRPVSSSLVSAPKTQVEKCKKPQNLLPNWPSVWLQELLQKRGKDTRASISSKLSPPPGFLACLSPDAHFLYCAHTPRRSRTVT